jgi:hypothetical protein
MESNQPTILVLLDFSKVFDSVCHGLLCCVCAPYQKDACGDNVPLVAGVPQGSSISPLYFSLFIDDMTEVLEFSKYHMYAVDLQIYHSRPRPREMQ